VTSVALFEKTRHRIGVEASHSGAFGYNQVENQECKIQADIFVTCV
jgi:hypothetical protein